MNKDDLKPRYTVNRDDRGFNSRYQEKRRNVIQKDLPLYRRYPRTFCWSVVGSLMIVFFSKPLYDIFIAERPVASARRAR